MNPMPEKPDSLQLMEPASPDALLPDSGVSLWWMAAAIVAVSVLVSIIVRWRKRIAARKIPIDPRVSAYEAAVENLAVMTPADARSTAVQCSLILRRYLADATRDRALFETHEEFVSRQDSMQALTEVARSAAATVFNHLASLKYAPETPSADPASILADSRALLATLHNGFKR